MTLKDKNWLKNEIFREYLAGDSQENIAKKLNVSVGTVNNLVSEIVNSDDTITQQRQIAIVAKKKGMKIIEIAANLRWKNKIKEWSLDDRKIEKFLDGLDILFNKHSIPASKVTNKLFSIIEFMLRYDIELDKLEEEIRSKYIELEKISAQIEARDMDLEEAKARVEKKQKELRIKDKDLLQFHKVSKALKLYLHPEISTEYGMVARTLINFKSQGYDPKAIVALLGQSENLAKKNEERETKLQEMEDVLEFYTRRKNEEESKWRDYDNDFEKINSLIKQGLTFEDIFTVANVLKNDFPKMDIHQIIKEINTYGGIKAARLKQQRVHEIASRWMLDT